MTKSTRTITITLALVIVALAGVLVVDRFTGPVSKIPLPSLPAIVETPEPEPLKPEEPKTNLYTSLILSSTSPMKELKEAVGVENVDTVLRVNRIDERFLRQNMEIVVPSDMSDLMKLSPMPATLPIAQTIPKLMVISQRVQAFGAYEYGTLVKWGPVSSGKKSTPTPSKLFFANWKGKEVISTANDEWILKWNFNLDNFDGIGMHLYEMPGHPASHSCVRLLEADALFLYDWTEQWILARDGQTLLAHGSPVLISGAYDFSNPAPWKALPVDPNATAVSVAEIEEQLFPSIELIKTRIARRAEVLGQTPLAQ